LTTFDEASAGSAFEMEGDNGWGEVNGWLHYDYQ
jgi:hypothetical protein